MQFDQVILRECIPAAQTYIQYLRNRKHFPCFYRVIETCVKVWEKR